MCELCGCGGSRSVERDARSPSLRVKPINVRVVGIAAFRQSIEDASRDPADESAVTIRAREEQPAISEPGIGIMEAAVSVTGHHSTRPCP